MFAPGIWATAHEHIFHAGEGPCPFASMLCGLLQNGNLRTLGGYPTFPANFAQEQGLSPKIEEAIERKNLKSRSERLFQIARYPNLAPAAFSLTGWKEGCYFISI